MLTAIIVVGFAVAVAAWIFAALGGSRSAATLIFAAGFIAATIGMCTRIALMPRTDGEGRSTLGLRLGAVGFALAAIPVAIGSFFLGIAEEDLVPFFYTGGVVILIGILISWISLTRGS